MLSLFRNNRIPAFLLLVGYTIALKLHVFFIPIEINFSSNAPFAELFFLAFEKIVAGNLFFVRLIAIACIFIQALMINSIVNKHKLFGELNFIPSLSFVLLTSWFPEFNFLTPTLLAMFPIIIAFGKLIQLYHSENYDSLLFDAAFLIAFASLLWLPSVQFLFWLFITLGVTKPFNLRIWIVGFLGFLVPYFLAATYFFWNGQLTDFIEFHVLSFINNYSLNIEVSQMLWLKTGILLTVACFYLIILLQEIPILVLQLRKVMGMVVTMLLFSLLTLVLQPSIMLIHFVILVFPLSLVFSYHFSQSKRSNISEWIHLSLFIMVLIMQYINFVKIKNPFT